jgi:hypothetical protein
MKRLQMTDTRTLAPTRFLIPGGWVLRVPDFTADPEYEAQLTGVLMPGYMHDQHKARTDARQRIDQLGRSAFVHAVRLFVQRCAVDYGRRYPEKIRKDRSLEGFDPETVALLYIPSAKAVGKEGRNDIRNLLTRMAG